MWTNRGLNHQPPIEDDVLTSDSDDDTPVVLGLAGRISTADGRILSDPTIILELQRMEHERSQEQLRRAERAAQRAARSTTLMSYQFDCCFANFLFLKGLTGLQKHICYDSTRNIYQVVVVPGRLPLTRMESETEWLKV